MVHACDPSTQGVERQENQELKVTSATYQVCGQLESHEREERERETLSLLLLEIPQLTPETSGLQDPPQRESLPAWTFSVLLLKP